MNIQRSRGNRSPTGSKQKGRRIFAVTSSLAAPGKLNFQNPHGSFFARSARRAILKLDFRDEIFLPRREASHDRFHKYRCSTADFFKLH